MTKTIKDLPEHARPRGSLCERSFSVFDRLIKRNAVIL